MATEQVTVIEGDGSSDTVTVTDDPVENQTVQAVRQAIGDETTASEQADSTVAATLLERVTALVDALTSGQADDEVRVALATDLLSGNLDVDLAAASAEPLDVSGATVTVQEDTPLDVSAAEVDVDLASQTGPALDVSGATVAVQEASALDVSAATVDVQEATALDVSASTVPVEQQTPIQVEDSGGTAIDPATTANLLDLEEGGSLQDIVDAVVDAGLALAIDHPAETRVGLDVSSGVTIGPLPVQRAADIAVAANPTGGGDVSVTVDHTDVDGNLFASDSPISGATSASKGTVPRHGTHVRIDLSGTDTSVNFHLDTHE